MDRYVYMLLDEGVPFYVGKGTHRPEYENQYRRLYEHIRESGLPVTQQSNRLKCAYINRIIREGRTIQFELVEDGISEEQAVAAETQLIRQHKRIADGGILTNLITRQPMIAHETRRKKVYAFSKTGELLSEFDSIKAAANAMGCSPGSIVCACKGKYNSVRGLVWSYTTTFPGFADHQPWNKRSIACYTPDGDLITSYESAQHAERLTGISQTAISACIRGKYVTAGGFRWLYADDRFTQRNRNSGNTKRPVAQYNKDNTLMQQYDSIRDAETATGISTASISQCCVGRSKTAGGFIWRFIQSC